MASQNCGLLQPDFSLSPPSLDTDGLKQEVISQVRKELLEELHHVLPSRSGIPKPVFEAGTKTNPLVLPITPDAKPATVMESWQSLKPGVPLHQVIGQPKTCMLMTRGPTPKTETRAESL